MDMDTIAQQQQNRKVDMRFISDPDSVLRTTARNHELSWPKDSTMEKLPKGEMLIISSESARTASTAP